MQALNYFPQQKHHFFYSYPIQSRSLLLRQTILIPFSAIFWWLPFVVLVLFLGACSSTPSIPPENRAIRNEAGRLVQLGTKALREGQTSAAKDYYEEAYRLFTAVDDTEGRIRALDGLGRIYHNTLVHWEQALTIAQFSGERDLIALALLLQAEYQILNTENFSPQEQEKLEILLQTCITDLARRPLDKARALRIYGSFLRTLGQYEKALQVLFDAASIDQKEKAYIEFASDNYLIASVYSKKGIYTQAREYLLIALSYDKRAENSSGIASTYYALGLVAEKEGNVQAARQYYQRAIEIYTAINMKEQVTTIQKRKEELDKVAF